MRLDCLIVMTEIQPENKQAPHSTLLIHGPRISLRSPEIRDAEKVFQWERDDEVWRYDPHRPYSRTMRDFLPGFERNYVRGNGRQFWFIIQDEQDAPIGTITYFNVDQRLGQLEVGLGLGEKNRWGLGYGPEAIRTLVEHLFKTLSPIMRVYAETAVANRPARRAFAKAGFSEVGQIYDPRSTGDPWILLEIWRTS
jgi:ribosomal-protein-alanine N-acetyltransferase